MINELSEFVPRVHFELVPIKDLVSNQDYQRNLSWCHVKKAVENFDLNQVNPIKVSRRDGINYVFNGQHTAEIIALASGSRDTPVWCMVYDDLDYTVEADIFANQMKNVKPLMPYEIFNANCEAGSDTELMIRDLVESYDLKISPNGAPGCICAVGALETVYEKYGYGILDRVLKLIVMAWEGEPKSFTANMLKGLARFLNAYRDRISDDMFKDKLGEVSIKELTKTAKERRAGSLGFAEAMLIVYNKRLKPPLPWNDLYSNKTERRRGEEASVLEMNQQTA
jgi:hypothetical protein